MLVILAKEEDPRELIRSMRGYQLRGLDRDWLVQAGRSVSVLLKDDYDRLRLSLSQIHT